MDLPALPSSPLFLQSLWIGLSIAAPVGPIGLLTIQRTLEQGTRAGLATGLGAATADACYGALGAFGSRLVIDALAQARPVLLGLGCAVLLWMAWSLWRASPAPNAAPLPGGTQFGKLFAGTFVLTLSNPSTIFSFMAIFGALAAGSAVPAAPGPMIAGVFCGSALWWLVLCAGVGRWRARFDDTWRRRINRGAAVMLAGLALWQVVVAIQ